MASQSAHFNLTKPASTDNYSLTVVNDNTDIIDTQMYNNQQSAAKLMVGATANADGESGRVPAPTSADRGKYLKGDGTWDTPSGGGGGSSTLAGLTDVNLSSPTDGQALVYDETNQEWVNGNESVAGIDFTQLSAQQIYDLKVALGLIDVDIYDYAVFDGTGYFTTTHRINSDYTVEVTFDADYKSPSSVYGNMVSPNYSQLTMYNNWWYMSSGAGEVNPIAYSSGKHTFKSNSNGKNIMDGVDVSTYTPTTYNTEYVIGNRYQSATYEGKFYEFKLTSISTGDVICDIVPAMKGSDVGLYDKITGLFTKCTYISSVANDV